MESLETVLPAWVQHIHAKIQTDYQSGTGAPLNEISLSGGKTTSTLEISIPDKKDMTGIKTQEKEVWVPATMVVKQVNGRLTRQKRKGYKRTQKVEIKDEESSSPRADSKPSRTGSSRWVEEKIIDYHFKKDFANFLAQHLGKDHKVRIQ